MAKEPLKKNGNGANLGFEAQLFLAADKLRLLPRLMSGEIRLREAEAMVEEVV